MFRLHADRAGRTRFGRRGRRRPRATGARVRRGRALAREPGVREVPQRRGASCDRARGGASRAPDRDPALERLRTNASGAKGQGADDEMDAAHALNRAVRAPERPELYERYARSCTGARHRDARPAGARSGETEVPLDEVEPAERIRADSRPARCRTDALSAEAHETLAIAMNADRRQVATPARAARTPLGTARDRQSNSQDQADRLGPLRRHARVLRVRRGAPDQDRAGLEAGRGRPAAGSQGDGRDRAAAAHAAGRRR